MISRGALLSSQDNKWSNVCGLGFQSPALRRSASDPYHPQQNRVSQRSTPTSSRPAHTPSVLHQSPINNLSNNLLHSGHQTSAGKPGPSGKPSQQRQAPIQEPAPRIQSPINHANGPHTNIIKILLKNNAPPDQRSSGGILKALRPKKPKTAEKPSRANQNFLHTILFTTPT